MARCGCQHGGRRVFCFDCASPQPPLFFPTISGGVGGAGCLLRTAFARTARTRSVFEPSSFVSVDGSGNIVSRSCGAPDAASPLWEAQWPRSERRGIRTRAEAMAEVAAQKKKKAAKRKKKSTRRKTQQKSKKNRAMASKGADEL